MINNSLKNKTILLTGAAGHLGKEFSYSLSRYQANLILIDKNKSQLINLQTKLKKNFNIDAFIKVTDLEIFSQRVNLIKFLKKKYSKLDIIVNNAAFVGASNLKGWSTKFEKQSIDTWQRAIEVNLTSVFHLSRDLLPLLRKSKKPSIINIGSMHGIIAPEWPLYEGTNMSNPAAYSVSKAGIIHLTKWLASTLAPKVRVNCISPGGISRNQPISFVKKFLSSTPLKRMASESDIVGTLIFLCSDQSEYITGQNIIVDGGKTLY
tara:strand:- start:1173 stop:1964 length:792 start_codon:yes stop_codon:yes gene_type:complete